MKKMIAALIFIASSTSFAQSAVEEAAANMKANDVRTVAVDANKVELQVKQASYNHETKEVVYTWQTVKTVTADRAAEARVSDVRTVIKEVENTDGNPCMPEGKSFLVALQVKQAYLNRSNNTYLYLWETAKKISVDNNGNVMEVCAE